MRPSAEGERERPAALGSFRSAIKMPRHVLLLPSVPDLMLDARYTYFAANWA